MVQILKKNSEHRTQFEVQSLIPLVRDNLLFLAKYTAINTTKLLQDLCEQLEFVEVVSAGTKFHPGKKERLIN